MQIFLGVMFSLLLVVVISIGFLIQNKLEKVFCKK